ncbi:MAG TPA: DUF5522 domain-containing protein [Chitinophagaceae bacterium]|nr:DUF5522 domain-containing protein [Chitinophagaceae bacterium]
MSSNLIENIDYYFNDDGLMVLTEKFHLQRGYCCGNGCRHCPYDYEAVPLDKKERMKKAQAEGSNRFTS